MDERLAGRKRHTEHSGRQTRRASIIFYAPKTRAQPRHPPPHIQTHRPVPHQVLNIGNGGLFRRGKLARASLLVVRPRHNGRARRPAAPAARHSRGLARGLGSRGVAVQVVRGSGLDGIRDKLGELVAGQAAARPAVIAEQGALSRLPPNARVRRGRVKRSNAHEKVGIAEPCCWGERGVLRAKRAS